MLYKHIFEQHIHDFLKQNNLTIEANTAYSDFEDYQYQTAIALSLHKINKSFNPQTIADFLNDNYPEYYEKIKVTGPGFISVKLNIQPQEYPEKKLQKVIIDYCGVNVAKQMHIGHIRSMFIGDYIARLHQKLGDEVVIFNHIGDWGNQFGYLLNYIISNNLEDKLDNKSLTQYYKIANNLNSQDPTFAKDSEFIAHKLQNKSDSKIVELWKKLVNISMIEADKTFKEFNLKINLEHTQGESFYAPFCKDILNDLLKKGIAQPCPNGTGSILAFFDDKAPLVLQKSNGNFLYSLYDIAAIKWRAENINPDKILYVVDKRQSLHFEQVFDIAKKAGYANDKIELIHIGFGTILGNDKKPLKTKSGESLYLDDLLTQGKEILNDSEYFKQMEPQIKDTILQKSIIGGLKYYDLKFNKTQDYVFDWKHVLNFSGGSAPYIQNALVRIDSIFEKAGLNVDNYSTIDFDKNWTLMEKNIIFQCQKSYEIIFDSINTYGSQTLCENIIKTCQLFHNYYEHEQVLGHSEQDKKLQLLGYIYNSLKEFTDILGIEVYPCKQKMLKQKSIKVC